MSKARGYYKQETPAGCSKEYKKYAWKSNLKYTLKAAYSLHFKYLAIEKTK